MSMGRVDVDALQFTFVSAKDKLCNLDILVTYHQDRKSVKILNQ